jgi:hypothetical protein
MSGTITRRFARYIALPVVSAGIVGGVALGMAGMANAATTVETNGHGSTSIVTTPDTKAYPAPDATPGGRWHRHHMSIGLAPALGFGE